MTTITDMSDEVCMLELEVQKLELNRRIAQLKAESLIDDECVGCAGPCDVVKLQEELNKLNCIVENRNETVSDLLHNDKQLNMFLDEYEETVKNRDKTIRDLEAKNARFVELRSGNLKSFDKLYCQIAKQDTEIKALEAELSARKEDSKVLMDVVGVAGTWDKRGGRAYPSLLKIVDLLVDYIDEPELPIREEDSNIDEEHYVTIKVGFLELP